MEFISQGHQISFSLSLCPKHILCTIDFPGWMALVCCSSPSSPSPYVSDFGVNFCGVKLKFAFLRHLYMFIHLYVEFVWLYIVFICTISIIQVIYDNSLYNCHRSSSSIYRSCFKYDNQRICIFSEIFYLKNTATVYATVKQCLNHHILLPPVWTS